MISKESVKLLNEQVTMEAESSAEYLAMACWAECNGFRGSAAFMFRQAEQERTHMHKLIRFLIDVDEQPLISGLREPKRAYNDISEIFEAALSHEKKVTASINNIYTSSHQNSDHAVTSFIQWFIDEQVEEESVARQALDIIRLAGKDKVYLADKEIGGLDNSK